MTAEAEKCKIIFCACINEIIKIRKRGREVCVIAAEDLQRRPPIQVTRW